MPTSNTPIALARPKRKGRSGIAGSIGNPIARPIVFEQRAGVFEMHQVLLPMSSTFLLKDINTAELVKAWQFLFVLGHNKYQGTVQSMINPVAIR